MSWVLREPPLVIVWIGSQVVAAIMLAAIALVPAWRKRVLYTWPGVFLSMWGLFGWAKIVVLGFFDLAAWSTPLATIAAIGIGIALLIGTIVLLFRWIRNCARAARPWLKVSGDAAFVMLMASIIVPFEWWDYHTRGKSILFGVNARCVEYSLGYCHKLDSTSVTGDAIAAVWLHSTLGELAVFLLMIGWLGIIGMIYWTAMKATNLMPPEAAP